MTTDTSPYVLVLLFAEGTSCTSNDWTCQCDRPSPQRPRATAHSCANLRDRSSDETCLVEPPRRSP
jgi:hypothetical protein